MIPVCKGVVNAIARNFLPTLYIKDAKKHCQSATAFATVAIELAVVRLKSIGGFLNQPGLALRDSFVHPGYACPRKGVA